MRLQAALFLPFPVRMSSAPDPPRNGSPDFRRLIPDNYSGSSCDNQKADCSSERRQDSHRPSAPPGPPQGPGTFPCPPASSGAEQAAFSPQRLYPRSASPRDTFPPPQPKNTFPGSRGSPRRRQSPAPSPLPSDNMHFPGNSDLPCTAPSH